MRKSIDMSLFDCINSYKDLHSYKKKNCFIVKKNRQIKESIYMRTLFLLVTLSSLAYGSHWTLQKYPDVKNKLIELIPSGEFHTLEVKYSAKQIMESNQAELLKSPQHKFLETQIRFYPYLLMEVKYSINARQTEESLILWDLCDGEMVIDTKDWQKTHGFGDCLSAGTNREEFKVIHVLARKGGSCDRDELIRALRLENKTLDTLIDSLKRKQLVVLAKNQYRLHLEKPSLKAHPNTHMSERLVSKTWRNAKKVSKRFSLSQVVRLSKAAFGDDFAIRHTSDVYLPVHTIVVENPDGSIHTSLWNALNGKRILYSYATD